MGYEFIYSNCIGISFFVLVFIIIIFFIGSGRLLTTKLSIIVFTALLAHIIAVNVYELSPSDSSANYFPNATLVFHGFGTDFAQLVSGVLKEIGFTTLLSQYYFSNAIGFLGAYFYFRTYVHFAKTAGFTHREYDHLVPYSLIWLWPSFMLWSTGVGKDSFMFLSISLIFYSLSIFNGGGPKFKPVMLAIIGGFFIWFLRPQVFLVMVGAIMMLGLFSKKVNFKTRVLLLLVFVGFMVVALPVILKYGQVSDISGISQRALKAQISLSSGTAISVPTHDPRYLVFFLPYTMLANLFLPLFLGVKNLIGVIASVENLVLLYLTWHYCKYRRFLYQFFSTRYQQLLKYMEFYLLMGIGFLGLLNTNLGLAMREKIMFTAPFMLLIAMSFLVSKKYRKMRSRRAYE